MGDHSVDQKPAQKISPYHALTEQEYAKVFSTFIAKTTEYDAMMELVGPVIKEVSASNSADGKESSTTNRPIRVMSIGAGTGCFETFLREKQNLRMSFYYGLEPNEAHIAELEKTVGKWREQEEEERKGDGEGNQQKGEGKLQHVIDTRLFTADLELKNNSDNVSDSGNFDLIILSHCMYCMQDKRGAMLRARSFLNPNNPNASLVIFHQSDKGCYELYNRMIERAGLLQGYVINDHSFSGRELVKVLESAAGDTDGSDIKFLLSELPSTLEIDDFVKKKTVSEAPTVNDVMTFFLQTPYEKLEKNLQEELYEMARERCVMVEASELQNFVEGGKSFEKKSAIIHPSAMLRIWA